MIHHLTSRFRILVLSQLSVVALYGDTAPSSFEDQVLPFLETHCYDCHGDGSDKGGVAFDAFDSNTDLIADTRLWLAVLDNVRAGLMPPKKDGDEDSRPSKAEIASLEQWIKSKAFGIDPEHPNPGRVTARRLNRIEYQHTIHDLMDHEFKAEFEFPPDDSGNGFDNNGEVLTLSTMLIEKYFNAAQSIVSQAVPKELNDKTKEDHARFFPRGPAPEEPGPRDAYAREVLGDFVKRAFRRPVEESKVVQLARIAYSIYTQPERSFEEGIGQAMMTVLASPRFLFRIEETMPLAEGERFPKLDEHALASRLSYFLWSTMPDETLMELADQGALRRNLSDQVKRMLKDSRSSQGIVKQFTGQWLQARDVITVEVNGKAVLGKGPVFGNRKTKYDFDGEIRKVMRKETELYFEHILREDRSVTELIESDYTFLNEKLAKQYDIDGVEGKEFRKVTLPKDSPRGGVLTQGTVLAVTSNPTRTSPVKRGVYILENILGTPPPPPPPDIPELEAAKDEIEGEDPSLREMLALHASARECRSCHNRMDPLGLAFENFIPMGNWRDKEGEHPIDPAGQLITGEKFQDVRELKSLLANERRLDYYRCLTKKMLAYALGRGLDYRDTHVIDTIVERLVRENGQLSALIYGIIESDAFQKQGTLLPSSNSPTTSHP